MERSETVGAYAAASLSLFPFSERNCHEGPDSISFKDLGLLSVCRPEQEAGYIPCFSSAATFHLQATAPLSAAGN